MTRLRRASPVLVALAALVVTGTGAFGTIDADRTAEVGVADEGQALVGLEPHSVVTDNPPTTHNLLTVTNRLRQPISVTIAVEPAAENERPKLMGLEPSDADSEPPGARETRLDLDPGAAETVRATVNCNNATDGATWDVDVSVDGESIAVEATDTVRVICTGEGRGGGGQNGGGNGNGSGNGNGGSGA
jgi:hypothetical protein